MKHSFAKSALNFALAGIIFLIPSNLFVKVLESSGFVHGLLSDYLLPKLYLSDIAILIFIVSWIYLRLAKFDSKKFAQQFKKFMRRQVWVMVVLIGLVAYQATVAKPVAAIWYLVKIFELLGLAGIILSASKYLSQKVLMWALLMSISFQSLLAIYQFVTQSQLVGYLFLGEPNLSHQIGLAKSVLSGAELVLPYGTTAHPNILAGTLVLMVILAGRFIWHQSSTTDGRWAKLLWWFALAATSIIVYLTQSVSAGLALIIGGIIWAWPKKIKLKSQGLGIAVVIGWLSLPLGLIWVAQIKPNSDSVTRRVDLQATAWRMFVDHPLLGVGLNNFTARIETYSTSQNMTRFIQPVHHVGWLWMTETGLVGVMLLMILLKALTGKYQLNLGWLAPLLPLAGLDHYLLTQQTGLLVLTLYTCFMVIKAKDSATEKA